MGVVEQGTELTGFTEIKAVHWSWPSKAYRETSLGAQSLLNASNPQVFPLELTAQRTYDIRGTCKPNTVPGSWTSGGSALPQKHLTSPYLLVSSFRRGCCSRNW